MKYFILVVLLSLSHCAMRNYTYYLVDPPIEKSELIKLSPADAIRARGPSLASSGTVKVRWNDGNVYTEVDVPILENGQYILIEHKQDKSSDEKLTRSSILPPPPTKADESIIEAYKEKGLKENPGATNVSITKSRVLLQNALKLGNYSQALEYAELVLARYPSHPEFLRAKGSVLLLMGEREKAILIYEKAEEVESEPSVRKKLEELRKNQK